MEDDASSVYNQKDMINIFIMRVRYEKVYGTIT